MLPALDASFVLYYDYYLQNPTPDDGVRVALDLLLHDDDTPLLNIDPEQTLDPTPNDPLTSTVPSPINSQSSHASLPNIVVLIEYLYFALIPDICNSLLKHLSLSIFQTQVNILWLIIYGW